MNKAPDSAVGLWAFCQSFYREPGIEAFCLQLQDKQQVNVLILLWCTWLGAHNLSLRSSQLLTVNRCIKSKSRETIIPLRELRRRLKLQPDIPQSVRQEARGHLLQAELVLEKQLLQELEALSVEQSMDSGEPLSVLIELESLEIPAEELAAFKHTANETCHRLTMLSRGLSSPDDERAGRQL